VREEIALKTLRVVLVLFIAGFLIILLAGIIGRIRDKKTLWKRYIAWYIIAPFILITSYLGLLPFTLGVLILIEGCLFEFFRMTGILRDRLLSGVGFLIGLLSISSALIKGYFLIPVIGIIVFPLLFILRDEYEEVMRKIPLAVFGSLYCGWLFSMIILIQKRFGFGYIVLLAGMIALNDILAYTIGRLFGRRKISPKISPNKTLAGCIGGILGALFGGLIFSYAVPYTSLKSILPLGILIGITGQIGDLVVSLFKRDAKVKDTGSIIPGHGGILDRCDSLILSVPVFYYWFLYIG